MAHIDRVLGICLIHATGTTPGLLGSLKDKVGVLYCLVKLCVPNIIVVLSQTTSVLWEQRYFTPFHYHRAEISFGEQTISEARSSLLFTEDVEKQFIA